MCSAQSLQNACDISLPAPYSAQSKEWLPNLPMEPMKSAMAASPHSTVTARCQHAEHFLTCFQGCLRQCDAVRDGRDDVLVERKIFRQECAKRHVLLCFGVSGCRRPYLPSSRSAPGSFRRTAGTSSACVYPSAKASGRQKHLVWRRAPTKAESTLAREKLPSSIHHPGKSASGSLA